MEQFEVHRIFLLVISLIKNVESTELLAEFKKCGDVECETLISRAVAIRDYKGPDCQYLNFKTGEEIFVYAKLSGEREDLWAGSKGKDFGYFPKDAIQIEEVFISEEVKVPIKESDFICLHEKNYVFENEKSILYNDNEGTDYSGVEEKNKESNVDENELQRTLGTYLTPENTELDNQSPRTESLENIRRTYESGIRGKVEPESLTKNAAKQDFSSHVAQVDPSSSSWVRRWFGLGSEEVQEETFKSIAEIQQENSFLIVLGDENDLKELNIETPLEKHESETPPKFDPCPLEQTALQSGLEEIPDPQTTTWLDDDLIGYFDFGQGDSEFKLLSKKNNSLLENTSLLEDIPINVPSDQEPIVPHTEKLSEVEEPKTKDYSAFQPSWFDLGFSNMLYFAYAEEEQRKIDKQQREGSSRGNDNEKFSSNNLDLDHNEEREIKEIGENEDQTFKKTGEYLERLFDYANNHWNSHNKSPFSKKLAGQDKLLATDKTEELSDESQITENMEINSKTKNSQSDFKMKYKKESQWQQEEKSIFSTHERNSAKGVVGNRIGPLNRRTEKWNRS
ncbi:melanoma inhibitory activity protein 2-like [Sminthopsis crassicaudata]|uniref:melanoma inhibitory activity protein 2-like n=1 Tax=Sminthopsis crassicaudata TaxID=9301 RepID=UPI003D6857AC